jgi:flagellar biosynthesis/type III secretory pathway protein FliH
MGDRPVAVPLRIADGAGLALAAPEMAASEAQQIISEARAEADRITEEARAQGRAEALAEVAGALEALAGAGRALAEARATLEEDVTQEAALLAMEVAAKVVRAELTTRPELVVGVVQSAIRRAAERGRLVVRVNPADLETCRAAAGEIGERMGGIDDLRFVDEPRVTPGGCVVETVAGDVDATLETQIARITAAVAGPPEEGLL